MVCKQSQVGKDLLNLLPVKKFANVGSGKQKRNTKTTAFLSIFPGSAWPPPRLLSSSLVITASYMLSKSLQRESKWWKGVLRGCDQGIVVSFLHAFLLIPFFSMYVIHRLQRMSSLPWSTLSSDLGVLATVSHSFYLSFALCWAFFVLFKYVFPEVPPPAHGHLASFQKGHPCSLHPAKHGHKYPIPKMIH